MRERWYVTAAGTNAGATATKAASGNAYHVITDIYVFGDKDATILVYDGTTVVVELEYDISNENFTGANWTYPKFVLTGAQIPGAKGGAVSCVLDASTADCRVTICGYTEYPAGA